MSKTHHQALIIPEKGKPLTLTTRQTPTPSPTDLLIEIHAIALNPVDHYQRDTNAFIQSYPSILGSDIAGTIIETGSAVRNNNSEALLKPGTRVTALASCFFTADPDYGAFQKLVLVDQESVAVLPDEYSFVQGAVFPLAALTTWNGWVWAGLSPTRKVKASNSNSDSRPRDGVFVWGASSSIGALAVQEAKLMGFTVYATASRQHHEYIRSLGASRVFDYKDDDVKDQIVGAARDDGVIVRVGFLATGDQQLAVDTLDALRGEEGKAQSKSKLAIAPMVDPGLKVPEGVESVFVYPPQDPGELKERMRVVFGGWLERKLAGKQLVASPHIKVIKGGLEAVNGALDELKAGVSCLKIVVEL